MHDVHTRAMICIILVGCFMASIGVSYMSGYQTAKIECLEGAK